MFNHIVNSFPQASIGKISLTTDLWSDPNLTPFMAVTAHWIQATIISTPQGSQYLLKLRADLIGFCRVPGHHDGEHLSHAFIHILERFRILRKVGHSITLHATFSDDTIDWLGDIR